jgi:RNA polymerase sigma-70 factor (ECF subfamily)
MRHLVAMGSEPGDIEDLTATVFLELWRRRGDARMVNGSVLAWLLVTAQNVSRNAARSRRRYQLLLASLPGSEDSGDYAELFAERNDARASQLRAAIERCSALDASLLAMTALEGFTVAEAGAALGVTEAAAKMRISRVRSKLRSSLSLVPVQEGGA